jgi:hypothetical protein
VGIPGWWTGLAGLTGLTGKLPANDANGHEKKGNLGGWACIGRFDTNIATKPDQAYLAGNQHMFFRGQINFWLRRLEAEPRT